MFTTHQDYLTHIELSQSLSAMKKHLTIGKQDVACHMRS